MQEPAITFDDDVRLPQPPADYEAFLQQQANEHERKDHDYQSRFMRGLIEHGRGIWDWEVDKKLDRIRTWIQRSELWVKGEGINNSVGDLFNYTVQFVIFLDCKTNKTDPMKHLTRDHFYMRAVSSTPEQWVDFLIGEGRIQLNEKALQFIIRHYMGDKIGPDGWIAAMHRG